MHLPAAAVRLSRECCIGKQAEKVTPCPPAVDLLCLSVLLAQAPLAPACGCQANHWPGVLCVWMASARTVSWGDQVCSIALPSIA